MNNKLFKRIVAAAASAVMLGSCAFATTLSNVSYDGSADNGVLSFTYNNGKADKVTYVAYAATKATAETDANAVEVNGTKYVLGEMVAINQFDGLTVGTDAAPAADTPVAVKIDKTKLTNAAATDIVLKSGDSLGSTVAVQAIALATTPVTTERTITFANVQEGYATPTLKVADGSLVTDMLAKIADPTKAKGTKDKLDWAFVGWYTDEALTTKLDKSAEAKITADMTLYAKYVQVYIVGDVNGDGKVTNTDITALKKYMAKTLSATQQTWGIDSEINDNVYYKNAGKDLKAKNGDVNGDGKVTNTDITALKKYMAKTLSATQQTWGIGEAMTIVKD